MPYFLQLEYYKPQEFNYSDLQAYNEVAAEFQQLGLASLDQENRAMKYHQIEQRLRDVSPIAKSLINIDQALRDAILALISDVNRRIIEPNVNIAQATAIKGVCEKILAELAMRLTYQPVWISDLERILATYGELEELQDTDLATWYIQWLRAIISTHHMNLQKIYEPTFDAMAKEAAYQMRPPAATAFVVPSAPAMGASAYAQGYDHGAQESLYPDLEIEDPYASASAPPLESEEYGQLSAALEEMRLVRPDEIEIEGAQVMRQLEIARQAAMHHISALPDSDPEFQSLWEVVALCENLERKVGCLEIITMKVINAEIAKIKTTVSTKTNEILTRFTAGIKPIEAPQEPLARAEAAAVAPSKQQVSVGASYASLFTQAQAISARDEAIDSLIKALDDHITERSKIRDPSGKIARYAGGAWGQFGANVFGGQNQFSDEEKAINALKAKLKGKSTGLSEADVASHKVTFSRGGPFTCLDKFIKGRPDDVALILGTPATTPRAFIDTLFSREFDSQLSMTGPK